MVCFILEFDVVFVTWSLFFAMQLCVILFSSWYHRIGSVLRDMWYFSLNNLSLVEFTKLLANELRLVMELVLFKLMMLAVFFNALVSFWKHVFKVDCCVLITRGNFTFLPLWSKTCSEPCQASKMHRFMKIVKD